MRFAAAAAVRRSRWTAHGRGTVYAAVSREPFRFEGFVLGDHWDYRALAPSRLANDPEPELNELVRRMAQGSFDYDILNYEVVDRVVYASDYLTLLLRLGVQ